MKAGCESGHLMVAGLFRWANRDKRHQASIRLAITPTPPPTPKLLPSTSTMSKPQADSSGSPVPYEAVMMFWKLVTQIFFREIRPRGAFNIPRTGPVIFVAAPHNNQVYTISVSGSQAQ
jgi:hypothetical protein